MAPDGTTTNYYYDGIRPIWETDGAGGMTAQLDRDIFGNLLARTDPGGAQRYYHPDGLGSTAALTDELGAVAASMLYDAWGNVRTNDGSAHGKYRFTGAELDETTGPYHMEARFYDPAVGRWRSEDPVQDKLFEPLTLNFYTYVQSRPTILVDHDGRECAIFSFGNDDFGSGGCGGGGGPGGGGPGRPPRPPAETITATSNRGVKIMMDARLATRLARGWTSPKNFMGHFADHGAQVAQAFRKLSITAAEYAALATQAFQKAGGKAGIVELIYDGVKHWVMIVVNEFGEIVSFRPSGPP